MPHDRASQAKTSAHTLPLTFPNATPSDVVNNPQFARLPAVYSLSEPFLACVRLTHSGRDRQIFEFERRPEKAFSFLSHVLKRTRGAHADGTGGLSIAGVPAARPWKYFEHPLAELENIGILTLTSSIAFLTRYGSGRYGS